jgi:hypothetical protein
VAILNARRAARGLPALTAAEVADFQNTVLEERRRELFLQGNRLFDLRRSNLAPTPAPGVTYPAGGLQPKGGTYGAQLCYPLPEVERAANPNLPPADGGRPATGREWVAGAVRDPDRPRGAFAARAPHHPRGAAVCRTRPNRRTEANPRS